ncbi:MAG: alpha/beta fold hydrolase [Kiritimatiellae bacterium]|nr:alpha/beta fold hydrolase [Kiritimatiellia bacterium]
MMKKQIVFLGVFALAFTAPAGNLTDKIASKYKVKVTDTWHGGQRTVFDFQGYDAWVVEPPADVKPIEGKPWTWTMQWRTAFVPRTSVPRMLKTGYHHVSVDTFKEHMDEKGLAVSKAFQDFLVNDLGFAPKARLIGMSWGGFFSIRYAATYPENVAKIYLDAPLLSFDNFKHVPDHWKADMPGQGWKDDPRMPVNMAKTIVETGIPILLLYGGADTVVPPQSNCIRFAEAFKAAGGKPDKLKVIARGAYAHHPHGVEESENTIVDFFR